MPFSLGITARQYYKLFDRDRPATAIHYTELFQVIFRPVEAND